MQPSSLTRLQHMVKSTGDTISLPALKDYLEYMQESLLPDSESGFTLTEQANFKRYVADNGNINFFREKRSCWRLWFEQKIQKHDRRNILLYFSTRTLR